MAIHILITLNINNICKFKFDLRSTMTHLFFVLFLVCLYVCVCECLLHNNMRMYTSNQYSYVRGPVRECRSFRSGASGLPYYCAPLVCVSEVTELLAVWRHNKPKTKSRASLVGQQIFQVRRHYFFVGAQCSSQGRHDGMAGVCGGGTTVAQTGWQTGRQTGRQTGPGERRYRGCQGGGARRVGGRVEESRYSVQIFRGQQIISTHVG